ncbi:MAG: polysaccharide deacetylase family protein [Nitrososphaera sp.]
MDDVFEAHIRFLKTHFDILSFPELLERWKNRDWNSRRRYCVITFDDGWMDNYLYAYPILKHYNIPATIFLPTAFIGTNQWFWPEKVSYLLRHYYVAGGTKDNTNFMKSLWGQYPWLKAIKGERGNEQIDSIIEMFKEATQEEIDDIIERMRNGLDLELPDERALMNWEEVREMSGSGVSFGSHSSTHRILRKLTTKEIENEIKGSLHTLLDKNVNSIPVFCYPNGFYTQEVARLVKSAGYQAAASARFGVEGGIPQDLYGLKRVSVHNDISATIPLFTFHISGLNHLCSFIS